MAFFLGMPKSAFFDSSGNPLTSGKVYTYVVGTTTNQASYPTIADAIAATNANANPVVLDSRGEAIIVSNLPVKIKVDTSADVNVFTVDNIDSPMDIYDSNGNEIIDFTATASAVNHVKITNAATTGNPKLEAAGDDTNITLDVGGKGTGTVRVLGTSTASAEVRLLEDTDNGTNYMGIKAPAAVTTSTTLTLPDGDGAADNLLTTTGAGVLQWASVANLKGAASTVGEVRLAEYTGNGTHYTGFKAPTSLAGNIVYELPVADGSADQILKTSGAGVLSWTSTNSAASQAEMEAASSTTVSVTPGRTKFHPGVAKAWATMDSAGVIGTSYGVTSIADNGTGDISITLSTAFSSSDYLGVGCVQRSGSGATVATLVAEMDTVTYTRSTTVFRIGTFRADGGVIADATRIYCVMYGDQ